MAKLVLDRSQVEELLVETITGKRLFDVPDSSDIYAVRFPTISEKDSSRLIYARTFKRLRNEGMPSKADMESAIFEMGMLPASHKTIMGMIEKQIEANQKALSMSNSKMQKIDLQAAIDRSQEALNKMQRDIDRLLENTAEMKAEDSRLNYLISCCTMKGEELSDRVWPSYEDYRKSTDILTSMIAKKNFISMYIGIPSNIIRALARSDEWRSRWKICKNTGSPMFSGTSAEWDKNKVSICYWSDFYDTIFGYHTPPPEDIIQDDDALFDWIREVNRVNSQESKKQTAKRPGKTVAVNQPYKIRPSAKEGQFNRIG
jgi:hypothetical protein